jgi:hypothetical protein
MGERVRVVSALVEGTSLRATERLTGVYRQAITNLLLSVGDGCRSLLDERMRDLHCDVLELDEVWSFVGCKEAHRDESDPPEYGDAYTWVALDATAKIIPAYLVGKRSTEATRLLGNESWRITGRSQHRKARIRPRQGNHAPAVT